MILVTCMMRHIFSMASIDGVASGALAGLGVGLFFYHTVDCHELRLCYAPSEADPDRWWLFNNWLHGYRTGLGFILTPNGCVRRWNRLLLLHLLAHLRANLAIPVSGKFGPVDQRPLFLKSKDDNMPSHHQKMERPTIASSARPHARNREHKSRTVTFGRLA